MHGKTQQNTNDWIKLHRGQCPALHWSCSIGGGGDTILNKLTNGNLCHCVIVSPHQHVPCLRPRLLNRVPRENLIPQINTCIKSSLDVSISAIHYMYNVHVVYPMITSSYVEVRANADTCQACASIRKTTNRPPNTRPGVVHHLQQIDWQIS